MSYDRKHCVVLATEYRYM